jgi:hypothetical protein
MKFFRELLRAGFVGFVVLVVFGGVFASGAKAPDSPSVASIYGIGFAGFVIGVVTLLLLRLVGTGPKTCVALAPILAAFTATVCFAPKMLSSEKPEDLAGVIVLALLAGLFVGLVDASRTLTRLAANDAPPHDRI